MTTRFAKSTQRLDPFAARLWSEWRRLKLPLADETAILAVSGGADSVALLLGVHELTIANRLSLNIIVAHLDHRLRPTSRKESQAVARLAESLGLAAVIGRADVGRLAQENGDNLEQAARLARYSFLERTAKRKKANLVLVAHTMDDQAETVLLRLLRGSASEGLSGMESIRPLSKNSSVRLARPLLSWARRAETEAFCTRKRIDFTVDTMNEDETFSRVRVRRQLLPLMKSFNNRIVETLLRTATMLREDSDTLTVTAAQVLTAADQSAKSQGQTTLPALDVDVLAGAPSAVRRRTLRLWLSEHLGDLRRIERVHLLAVERLIEGNRGGRVAELPDGARVTRKQRLLELTVKKG